MERATAIKKLVKILGKKAGWRIDNGAPSKEERAAAQEAMKPAYEEKRQVGLALEKRRTELLAADAEYQTLLAAHEAIFSRCQKLRDIALREKITVGTNESIFFHVEATGDSWEEIFQKLAAKREKLSA